MSVAQLRVVKSHDRLGTRCEKLDPASFPDKPHGNGSGPPGTVENVRYLMAANGISARYNLVRKRTEITIPWISATVENADAVAMTHVLSTAARCGMPTGLVPASVEALGDENAYSPAADWILSRQWDGKDRLDALCQTLTPRDDYPTVLRDVLVKKWLLSAAAAAVKPIGFKCRGVLTLQGAQGIGKTSWGLSLIDDATLRPQLVKVDHHLEPGNKDSQIGAIEHWLVEIGELDSSFKRDVARLKGFLTTGTDKLRRPYAQVTSEYQRRTVFYATVNEETFLVDSTGNTRFWTIPYEHINHQHGIDMQQLFAQCAKLLEGGAEWWLTDAEQTLLEKHNEAHRSFSLVRDRLESAIELERVDTSGCEALTASEVLERAGFPHPTNSQAKECASILRQLFGSSKRYGGINKWRVPLRAEYASEEGMAAVRPDQRPNAKRSKFD